MRPVALISSVINKIFCFRWINESSTALIVSRFDYNIFYFKMNHRHLENTLKANLQSSLFVGMPSRDDCPNLIGCSEIVRAKSLWERDHSLIPVRVKYVSATKAILKTHAHGAWHQAREQGD